MSRPATAPLPVTLPPIPLADRCVIKRDGTLVTWDAAKITRAVALAFHEVQHGGAANPDRDNPAGRHGLDAATFAKVRHIVQRVAHMLELFYRAGRHPGIEQIQDHVEKAIAAEGEWAVARAYIVYRAAQAARRLNSYPENGLADYIATAKYARYRPDLGRRELFPEAVRRVHDMHRELFLDGLGRPLVVPAAHPLLAPEDRRRCTAWLGGKTLGAALDRAFAAVAAREVLPSMRSLQFGGDAILLAGGMVRQVVLQRAPQH